MNDEQFQAWLDQHGGEVGRKNNEKQIDGPADPQTGQPTKQTAVDSTTITAADGATLTLRRTPGPINAGHDYEEVGRTPPKRQPAAQTGVTGSNPRVPAGSIPAIEGTPVPGQPGQYDNSQPIRAWHTPDGQIVYEPLTPQEKQDWERQKNGGKTDAEIQAANQDKIGKPTGNTRTTTANGRTVKETEYQLPDGTTVWRSQTEQGEPDRVGKPTGNTRTRTEGGQSVKEVEYVLPDGTKEWRSQTGEATGTPAEPAGAPSHSAPYGAVAESLVRYRDFINQAVRDGRITSDQADRLMAARLADAKAQSEEQQNVVGTQTGIYGQNLTQRGQSLREVESRRNAANSIYTSVLGQFVPLLKYMPKGGGQAFLDLLSHGVGAAQLNAGAWGGLTPVPEIQLGPAAAAANRAPMPGSGALPPAAATAPSVAGTILAPYDPASAAAAEAARQASSASVAAQNAQTPQNVTNATSATIGTLLGPRPATAPLLPANRPDQTQVGALIDNAILPPAASTPVAPGTPLVAPGIPVNAYGNPLSELGPTPIPPYQDSAPLFAPRDPATYTKPAAAPVDQMPVPVPYPDNAGAQSFLSPYAQPRPSALQSLIADPDMPNHIVLQAFRDVFGYDPPGFAA